MRPITAPINRNSQGSEVTNLQDGLLLLLLRQRIQVSDGDRQEYQAGIRREQVAQVYDDFTEKVVAIFQKQVGLETTGEVNEPTAEALNKILKELGAFDPDQPEQFFV